MFSHLWLFVCAVLFASTPAFAKEIIFSTPRIELNQCQRDFAEKEIKNLAKSLGGITRLFGADPFKSAKFSPPEKLFYANNLSVLPAAKAGRDVLHYLTHTHCRGYEDQSPLNAVNHFAVAATITTFTGDKAAKRMLDLYEASRLANYDGELLKDVSIMDVYNNYAGIEAARDVHGTPDNRAVQLHYIELGLKMLAKGKLRTIRAPKQKQYCLIPIDAHGSAPSKYMLDRPTDKKVLQHYRYYEADTFPLGEKDRAAVVKIGAAKEDPLYQEILSYLEGSECKDAGVDSPPVEEEEL